ncbi:ABC1 kinase family protein [Turneriella parva]|uniref:ABC-1 domain-containing protein n=1 Tax=Turneriella parva (strain ATCC BAA-1111 / DSM 21527 / NCTC 11395 / H) TaxID=869212 RepID=I4BB66_TURPD|nr:AarF/ABC1/UbiB kinase family protein [Turneriella parva]AFM14523.1 ABC-1 domain-containing protein [Turneriella parva DSM 21527]
MGLVDNLKTSVSAAARVAQTSIVFARHAQFFTRVVSNPGAPETARELRRIFESLGATYIKLGQFIASAPGIFPDSYVTEMQALLDRTTPVDFADIEKVLAADLGKDYRQHFRSIEEIPLASASIAQVHAATLSTGESVVLKIQRPNIEAKMDADLGLMSFAARLLEILLPETKRVGVTDVIHELGRSMADETDFIQEAKNIADFQKFLDDTEETDVITPRVVKALSTKRVLTMSRLYGAPLTDLQVVRKYARDPRAVLEKALATWFQSLALVGFFHADVHAGNLMILEDGRIGFLDFGIVGRFSPKVFESLWMLVQGVGEKDYRMIARSLIGLDATGGGGQKVEEEKFAAELRSVFEQVNNFGKVVETAARRGERIEVDEGDLNQMILQIVGVARDNGLKIPREFALLIKQFLYFDRYAQILAPGMSVYSMGPEVQGTRGKARLLPK